MLPKMSEPKSNQQNYRFTSYKSPRRQKQQKQFKFIHNNIHGSLFLKNKPVQISFKQNSLSTFQFYSNQTSSSFFTTKNSSTHKYKSINNTKQIINKDYNEQMISKKSFRQNIKKKQLKEIINHPYHKQEIKNQQQEYLSNTKQYRQKINKKLNNSSISISMAMNFKKISLQSDINTSLNKINSSFHRYYQLKKQQESANLHQIKIIINCENLLKQLNKNGDSKIVPILNTYQKNTIQTKINTNYILSCVQSSCKDSIFPYQRYGPSMINYQNQLILYGGYITNKCNSSLFHKFNPQTKMWTKIQQEQRMVQMIPCYHTIDVYKNYMILVGGVSLKGGNNKRKFNSDICVYNLQKKQWLKLKSSISLRSHASTLFSNTLLIHGGIDQKGQHSNAIHFINFKQNSIHNSLILSTLNKQNQQNLYHSQSKLAFHKLVNTHEIQNNIKITLKYDGVFCFGGINQQQNMTDQLTFLNCINKQNGLQVRFKSWHIIQTKGQKPQPRKNHSLNIINKRPLFLLVGGQNHYGNILNDVWIFDLLKLQWKQIHYSPFQSPYQQKRLSKIHKENFNQIKFKFQKGISGHCTSFIGTKLYIFGGRKTVQNKKDTSLWYLQTDPNLNNNKKKKNQQSTDQIDNQLKQFPKSDQFLQLQF